MKVWGVLDLLSADDLAAEKQRIYQKSRKDPLAAHAVLLDLAARQILDDRLRLNAWWRDRRAHGAPSSIPDANLIEGYPRAQLVSSLLNVVERCDPDISPKAAILLAKHADREDVPLAISAMQRMIKRGGPSMPSTGTAALASLSYADARAVAEAQRAMWHDSSSRLRHTAWSLFCRGIGRSARKDNLASFAELALSYEEKWPDLPRFGGLFEFNWLRPTEDEARDVSDVIVTAGATFQTSTRSPPSAAQWCAEACHSMCRNGLPPLGAREFEQAYRDLGGAPNEFEWLRAHRYLTNPLDIMDELEAEAKRAINPPSDRSPRIYEYARQYRELVLLSELHAPARVATLLADADAVLHQAGFRPEQFEREVFNHAIRDLLLEARASALRPSGA